MKFIASLVVAGFLASSGVSVSATLDAYNETELIRQALIASGVEPGSEQLELRQQAISTALRDAVWRVGPGKPTYRRAYKLHRVLHRNYLRSYRIDVDDLYRVVEDGTFNCLSAVLFYGLAAQRLGFDTRIIEYPGHLLLELDVRSGPVRIETTSPVGFDIEESRLLSYGSAKSFGGAWLVMPPEASWQVPLEAAVGFTWLNRAWRTFEAGEIDLAVEFVEKSAARAPGLPERVEAAPRLLARAFVQEYELGRFESAYRIASINETLDPGKVSSQDRLLAAAQKRIEQLCMQDDVRGAALVRRELERFEFEAVAQSRFDQTVYPTIVAAAVRIGDWSFAETYVERYTAIEPDPVESGRLRKWVNSRRDSGSANELTTR